MEFTPEQQAHIDSLVADKTKNLISEEELQRRITAEADRRVESGIQKGLETQRQKWEQEYKSKAELSAEERIQQEYDSKMKDLTNRETELLKRSNKADAQDLFANAEVPKSDYEKFIDLLVSDDNDSTVKNVSGFIDTYNKTKNDIESRLKKELSKVSAPHNDPAGDKGITKDTFNKMTTSEQYSLKQKDPDLVKKLMR